MDDSENLENLIPIGSTASRKRKLARKWTSHEVRVLIEHIEERECIWNSCSAAYRNRDLRERSWAELSGFTNHPISDCKMQWNSIRTRYNAEVKKSRSTCSGQSGDTYSSKWEFFGALHFLTPIRSRSPGTNTVSNLILEDVSNGSQVSNLILEDVNSGSQETYELQEVTQHPVTPTNSTTPTGSKEAVYSTLQTYFQNKIGVVDEPKNKWKRSYLDYVYHEMCAMSEEDARK